MPMCRVKAMAMGVVTSMQQERGREMESIMIKEPVTVMKLVRIWMMSVARLVLTTSTS